MKPDTTPNVFLIDDRNDEALSLVRQYLGRRQRMDAEHQAIHQAHEQELENAMARAGIPELKERQRFEHDAFVAEMNAISKQAFQDIASALGLPVLDADADERLDIQHLESLGIAVLDRTPQDKGSNIGNALAELFGRHGEKTH